MESKIFIIFIKGLPKEWVTLLETSGIKKEEVLAKPNEILSCLEFQANFLQEERNMPIKEDNVTLSLKFSFVLMLIGRIFC